MLLLQKCINKCRRKITSTAAVLEHARDHLLLCLGIEPCCHVSCSCLVVRLAVCLAVQLVIASLLVYVACFLLAFLLAVQLAYKIKTNNKTSKRVGSSYH